MPLSTELYRQAIADFCRRWGVAELAIFGSALREDFRPDSDVDVMVTLEKGVERTFQDWLRMIEELERIFGRKVDLVERRSVERSKNYIRRRHILEHTEPLYVAR